MCDIIIMGFDKSNPDPDKDRHCWKRGYCIEGHDDGFDWGGIKYNEGYKILSMPGVLWADARAKLVEMEVTTDVDGNEIMYRRRRYKIDMTKLTPQLEAALKKTQTASATRIAALEATLIDQKTT